MDGDLGKNLQTICFFFYVGYIRLLIFYCSIRDHFPIASPVTTSFKLLDTPWKDIEKGYLVMKSANTSGKPKSILQVVFF